MHFTMKILGILSLAMAAACGVTSGGPDSDPSAPVSAETAAPQASQIVAPEASPQTPQRLRCEVNGGICELASDCFATLDLPGCGGGEVCCQF